MPIQALSLVLEFFIATSEQEELRSEKDISGPNRFRKHLLGFFHIV